MKIQITAGGVFGHVTEDSPSGELPIGTVLTLDNEPTGLAGRYTILSGDGEGNVLVVNPAGGPPPPGGEGETAPVPPFIAKGEGAWFKVYDANGKQVGKAMRAADAEEFNKLSDEDKAEYLKGEA